MKIPSIILSHIWVHLFFPFSCFLTSGIERCSPGSYQFLSFFKNVFSFLIFFLDHPPAFASTAQWRVPCSFCMGRDTRFPRPTSTRPSTRRFLFNPLLVKRADSPAVRVPPNVQTIPCRPRLKVVRRASPPVLRCR